MITPLIVAAGYSRRMGVSKARLLLGGVPLLHHIAATCRAAQLATPVVVVGCSGTGGGGLLGSDDVGELTDLPVETVVGRPGATPIDSIRAGLAAVAPGSHLLLWPVDCPFADVALLRRLVSALEDDAHRVVEPRVADRGAHPVLFGSDAAAELLSPLADDGARAVVARLPGRRLAVACDDRRLVTALNTPEAARRLGITPPGHAPELTRFQK